MIAIDLQCMNNLENLRKILLTAFPITGFIHCVPARICYSSFLLHDVATQLCVNLPPPMRHLIATGFICLNNRIHESNLRVLRYRRVLRFLCIILLM